MWHEARRSERKVHDLMDAARKRAQRRALYLAKRRGDPQQSLQVIGSRSRTHRDDGLYRAAEDLQGLIPWNGKQDILIDRFDGRALLDFIRDSSSRPFRIQDKTEEDEELEQFVNFERYRDLIKHRRRGFSDEEGIRHANQEIEARIMAPVASERSHSSQTSTSKGSYSQVGFSYDGDGNYEAQMDSDDNDDGDEADDEDVDDDDDKDFSSDDSTDEVIEVIAKEFGVRKYNWLLYMDKKAKEEEKRRKAIIKGDPSVRKLTRKERRKVSQIEREREREAARVLGRSHLHDPYREPRRSPTYEAYPRSRRTRSKSRSHSPSYSRRHDRGTRSDDAHRSKTRTSKIEYITEFGGSDDMDGQKMEAFSPPSSPHLEADVANRLPGGLILETSGSQIFEALHVDPASAASIEQEKNIKSYKPPTSGTSSGVAKLSKAPNDGGLQKKQEGEKKETPQERLKRIMSKQLNKQIKKDSAAEMAKKREQERLRQEKLAETNRLSHYRRRSRSRSYSRSPPRRYRRSRSCSRSRSPRRHHSCSRSISRSPRSRGQSRHQARQDGNYRSK